MIVAVFSTSPVAPGSTRTTRVSSTESPAASVPSAHVIVRAASVQGASAETNVTFAGSVSETATACASDGPAFAAVIVYVSWSPASTASSSATFSTETSATVPIVTSPVSVTGVWRSSLVAAAPFVSTVAPASEAAGVTGTVIVTVAPAGSDAIVHVIVPPVAPVSVKPADGEAVALPAV